MAFRATRILAFGDCDPSGIAYFPAYLDRLSGVVEEFFAHVGAPWSVLIKDRRIGTPTVKLDVTFERPSIYGDLLTFDLDVFKIGRASLDLRHAISTGERALWRAEQRLVATSLETHRAIPWPDDVRRLLSRHITSMEA